jgi:hypothetical protein
MLLAQQEATNQWAYYQAKVIREHLNRAQKVAVETQRADPSPLKGGERVKFEALQKRYADEEKRMNSDKKEIEVVAKKHEATRDLNQSKDPYFDYAEVLLQIAIVMATVAIISASRPVFLTSLVLALTGAFCTFNGYTLLFKVPFLSSH